MWMCFVFYIFALFWFCLTEPEGNVYTSIAHMEPLVEIERRLIKIARDYLDEEKLKINGLKSFARSVKQAIALAEEDPAKYLGNPVNSYLLIKRFTSGWKELGDLLTINESNSNDIHVLLKANEVYLPTYKVDMVGAVAAMFRLQDTYNITANEIAEGDIKGISRSAHQLTAHECLEIAEMAHASRRYVHMMHWLKETERIMHDPLLQDRIGNVTRLQLYEFMAWSNYLSNDMEEALRYTNLILLEDPTNIQALKNRPIYSWYVHWHTKSSDLESTYMQQAENVLKAFSETRYVLACRDENTRVRKVRNISNIACYYKSDKPRLVLQPLKVSRVHDNPEVLIFHNILTEEQTQRLKDIAFPRLRPAEVIDPINEEHITASYRVSKNVFFDYAFTEEQEISQELEPIVEDATNLSAKYSEQLQVNNYGLGGQYEFHVDHGAPGSALDKHEFGNRIATLLFYLSDVERGGHTVFTQLGLSLIPKNGDAVFWHNLYRNGSGIDVTEHASCPVVSGSKWVVNKWLHIHGNEFIRRCSLDRYDDY